MHDTREPHLAALKHILRYIRGTLDHDLQLYASPSHGYCVLLGQNLLSWSSKRQGTIFCLNVEAEYMGVTNAVA